jgi:gamma-glutamylcyclotransferase
MSRFHYFAYGSNLLTPRLTARCPSAKVIGRATATDYRFEFSKVSHRDGSAKATLRVAPGALTHGVVYEVDLAERDTLDRFEGVGLGYKRPDDIEFLFEDGGTVTGSTYIATDPQDGLRPFDWYLALILAGAREHALHASHVSAISMSQYDTDTDHTREGRIAAVAALEAAGHVDWLTLLP